MATRVSSISFFSQYVNDDDFSGSTSDFARVLVGSIGDKMRAIIQVTFSQKSTATTINEMTIFGNTITNTTGDFIADGFKIDDVIEFYNDQTSSVEITGRTITSITSTTITFDGAAVSPSKTYNNGRLLLTSQQTGLKFKYNLIENNESVNFISKIDGTAENVFSADGVSGVAQNMSPVAGVKSWQTEEDITVQYITTKTVADDYEQVFEIIHEFTVLPFYLDGELTNIQNNIKPNLFAGFNSLKYVLQCDLGADLISVDGTRVIDGATDNGSIGWYDENKNGLAPIYSFSSASYTDTDTASTVPGIQVNRQTSCSVIISASSSVFDVNHRVQIMIANSVSSGDYQQNNDNIFDNFVSERLITTVSDAAISGTIISDYECTVLSPTSLQVDFKIEYPAAKQSVIDGLNNIVWITPHDDGLTNKNTDRVAVLVPTQANYKSADEPDLVFVTDHEFYPQEQSLTGSSFTDVKGWKEDTYISKFDFDINTDEAVQIKRLEVKLGVYNPNDDSIFILDTASYTLTPVVVISGIQQFNIATNRGFELISGSDWNKQELTYLGTGVNGSINVAQYELICAMRLRYEDWIPLVTADPSFYDVTQPNDGLNMDSSRYDSTPFEVVTIVDIDVESASKQTSNYQFISPSFQVEDYDEDGNVPAHWPGVITLENGSGSQISVIDTADDTVIKATFTKDASGNAISNEWGRLRMYLPNTTFKQPFEISTYELPKLNQILKPLAGETQLKITNVADVITLEALIDKDYVSANDNWYISARIGGDLTLPVWTPADLNDLVFWGDAASSGAYINAGSPSPGDQVSTWQDRSGLNNDATQGTATRQPTWDNNIELTHDGTNDFLNLNLAVNDLATTTSGIWGGWINPSVFAGDQVFLSLVEGIATAVDSISLAYDSAGKVVASAQLAGISQWRIRTTNVVLSIGNFNHIVLRHNGTRPTLFIDGVQVSIVDEVTTDLTYWANDMPNKDNFGIGTFFKATPSAYMNGKIGETVLSGDGFTQGTADIVELYNHSKSIYQP